MRPQHRLRHLDAGPQRYVHQGTARRVRGGGSGREALSDLASADRPRWLHLRPRAWARPARVRALRRHRWAAVRLRQRAARRSAIPPIRGTRTTSATRSSGRTTWSSVRGRRARRSSPVKCDVLTKLHQGTHSKDAFTNNLHELVYHIQLQRRHRDAHHDADGDRHARRVRALLRPLSPRRPSAPLTPANSPDGGGFRAIPDRTCVEQFMLVPPGQQLELLLRAARDVGDVEQRSPRGRPHARVLQSVLPGAICRAGSTIRRIAPTVGRPIDVCYEVTADGRAGHWRRLRRVDRRRARRPA